jgi:formate dehydrogenase beta subunit
VSAGVEARAGRFAGPSLIPELVAIQAAHGWLPREELEALAIRTKRPLYEIQGLISFYPHFATEPPKPVKVAVCRDLSCWLRGGDAQMRTIAARYQADDDIDLHQVSCLGRCDIAPAAMVNARACAAVNVEGLVKRVRSKPLDHGVAGTGRRWPNDPYEDRADRYASLRAALGGELSGDAIVATLEESGLRGMGGAGFPTGRKWRLVAAEPSETKYVICNADESEVGTFKDREILADQPHLVLEGLLLGMVVTGAREGWLFIRHEYGPEADAFRAELERARGLGLVGTDVLGTGRDLLVDVFVSPGGYILGEETALLECMEGHRGEPRNKPPYPGTYGLWGKPTLMNNVETLADIPVILRRGAAWWQAQGTNGCAGLKFIGVSGNVEKPGVYCVPLGTSIRDLIATAGGPLDGKETAAVQPGGASSNFLGQADLDTPLDFTALTDAGSMLGSGAVIVMTEGTDLLAAATNVLRFFRNESCGKCVPCRAGTDKAVTILEAVLASGGGIADVDGSIAELEEAMRLTSICGLGQVALGPVMSVIKLARSDGAG